MIFPDFAIQFTGLTAGIPYHRGSYGVIGMVRDAGPVVKIVLLILLVLSLACWAIIFVKMRLFAKARRESDAFLDLYQNGVSFPLLYRESKRLEFGYLPALFRSGYTEWVKTVKFLESQDHSGRNSYLEAWFDGVEKAMEGAIISQRQRMESSLTLLATTGGTAPFIGLFGTVWGIMTSFQEIGLKGAANLAVVAPGISEALIATAMGLAAAVPAVVAYNHFVNRIAAYENEMNYFAAELSNLLKREWLRKAGSLKSGSAEQIASQK